jgi:hypothetical protein
VKNFPKNRVLGGYIETPKTKKVIHFENTDKDFNYMGDIFITAKLIYVK